MKKGQLTIDLSAGTLGNGSTGSSGLFTGLSTSELVHSDLKGLPTFPMINEKQPNVG